MKIAIDVHSLGSRASGNETYFQQLVRGLVADRSSNRYSLLYTHKETPGNHPLDERFDWIAIPQNPLRRILLSLPQVLRQLQPDVFHCQYIMPPRVKCKTVVSIHDLAYEHFPAMFGTAQRLTMKTLIPSAAKRADRILTLSQFCADDISRTYGIAREKIMVASPAVSEKFQPGDKLRARERLASKYRIESDFLLYVGRIQARKNLVRMVEAYARVRRQGATANLVIVGKPDYGAEQVFARIADLGLKEVVVFPGYVDGGDLPLFYQGAEAFVFPSLFEGFGLPVLESMACGIPTITSYGSSLEEVAGGAAVLVDPKSVDSIANAMEQILSSGEQRRDLGTRGLRRSADFTLENFVRQVLLVYESLA